MRWRRAQGPTAHVHPHPLRMGCKCVRCRPAQAPACACPGCADYLLREYRVQHPEVFAAWRRAQMNHPAWLRFQISIIARLPDDVIDALWREAHHCRDQDDELEHAHRLLSDWEFAAYMANHRTLEAMYCWQALRARVGPVAAGPWPLSI